MPVAEVPESARTSGLASEPSVPANQSVNVAQVNGIATLTGTGAQGTGAQRVTVATDSATVAGSSSLPAGSNVIGHVIADTGSTTAVTGTVTASATLQTQTDTTMVGGVNVTIALLLRATAVTAVAAPGTAPPVVLTGVADTMTPYGPGPEALTALTSKS